MSNDDRHSNFQGALLIDLVRYARIQPQVLQVELHPYNTQERLVALAKTFGIAITGYSSFRPQSWLELGMDKNSPSLLEHNTVVTIANKHELSEYFRARSIRLLDS